MPMIEMKNISKWYGAFQVLTDCTTQIEKGEVIVVCGPSGSGKSTLIKCVNGLEPFQSGEITVNGTNGVMVDGAKVVQADIVADNGVIHVIDQVIMPKM